MSRVAVITGGGRGLGAESGRLLAERGWNVVLADACADNPAAAYPLATAEDLEASVARCSGRAEGIVCDVREQSDVNAAVALAVDRFGRLDAAVACAGLLAGGVTAWDTTEEVWQQLLEVNLSGVWRLAKAAIPAILESSEPKQGRFVAVSSAAGIVGLPKLAGYGAAKHGVVGLVRGLAAELAPLGVTANTVCPGAMASTMLDATVSLYGLSGPDDFAVHHPLGRLLDLSEVAALVAWVCGPESSGVTGAVLPVDAGMTAV